MLFVNFNSRLIPSTVTHPLCCSPRSICSQEEWEDVLNDVVIRLEVCRPFLSFFLVLHFLFPLFTFSDVRTVVYGTKHARAAWGGKKRFKFLNFNFFSSSHPLPLTLLLVLDYTHVGEEWDGERRTKSVERIESAECVITRRVRPFLLFSFILIFCMLLCLRGVK